VAQQPVDAGHADVGDQPDVAAQRPGRDDRLAGHRQVTGAGRQHDDAARRRGPPGGAGRQPERPGDAVLLGGGEGAGEVGGLGVADAGGQAVLPGLGEPAGDALDPLGGLALAKNHLGEATPPPAVEVDVGVAEVGDRRRRAQACERGVDAQAAVADLFEERAQLVGGHGVLRGEGVRSPRRLL
jgi:hypothetical protein